MQEFIDFLGKQSPYDRLDPGDLARLGDALTVEYFAAGATIVGPDIGVLEYLAVIRTGVVTVLDRSTVVDELGPGDTFGQYVHVDVEASTVVVKLSSWVSPQDPQAFSAGLACATTLAEHLGGHPSHGLNLHA